MTYRDGLVFTINFKIYVGLQYDKRRETVEGALSILKADALCEVSTRHEL